MAELCLFLSTIKEYFSLILTLSDLASEIAMKPKGGAKCNTLDQWRSPLRPYVAKKYFETYGNYNNTTRWVSISQKFNKILRFENFEITRFCGVATIVQGAIVQGDSCPRGQLSKGQLSKEFLSKEIFVQVDSCPRRLLSKADFSPRRQLHVFLSKEEIVL